MATCQNVKSCEKCGKAFGCSCQCVYLSNEQGGIALCRDCFNAETRNKTNESNAKTSVIDGIKNIMINSVKWNKQ